MVETIAPEPPKPIPWEFPKTGYCVFPIGAGPRDAGFHFCGNPVVVDRPYCETHALLAYISLGKKKAKEAGG